MPAARIPMKKITEVLRLKYAGGLRHTQIGQASLDAIAVKYLAAQGYEAEPCASEDEARARVDELLPQRRWPCYFAPSDTTGEKDFEEFFTERETLDMARFESIGVIRNEPLFDAAELDGFVERIAELKSAGSWGKADLVALFRAMLPDFAHRETGKYLDSRM